MNSPSVLILQWEMEKTNDFPLGVFSLSGHDFLQKNGNKLKFQDAFELEEPIDDVAVAFVLFLKENVYGNEWLTGGAEKGQRCPIAGLKGSDIRGTAQSLRTIERSENILGPVFGHCGTSYFQGWTVILLDVFFSLYPPTSYEAVTVMRMVRINDQNTHDCRLSSIHPSLMEPLDNRENAILANTLLTPMMWIIKLIEDIQAARKRAENCKSPLAPTEPAKAPTAFITAAIEEPDAPGIETNEQAEPDAEGLTREQREILEQVKDHLDELPKRGPTEGFWIDSGNFAIEKGANTTALGTARTKGMSFIYNGYKIGKSCHGIWAKSNNNNANQTYYKRP